MDCLVQRSDAEVGIQRVQYPSPQNHARLQVHVRLQINEPATHRQACIVHTPDLVWPVNLLPSQELGVGLMPEFWPAGVGLLIDRHQAHRPMDALFSYIVAFLAQVPCHLEDVKEGRHRKTEH